MTIFFRCLARVPTSSEATDDDRLAAVAEADYDPAQRTGDNRDLLAAWLRDWAARIREEGQTEDARAAAMHAVNPKYVLRNYLAQLAIDDADSGNPALIGDLLEVLRHPYDEQPGKERFAQKRPDWARIRPGCSMLSCSS